MQAKRELRQEEINRPRKLWNEGIASGDAGPVDMNDLRREGPPAPRRRKKKRHRYGARIHAQGGSEEVGCKRRGEALISREHCPTHCPTNENRQQKQRFLAKNGGHDRD